MNYIEEALLFACIKKDRAAQFQLYKNCYPFLKGISARYVKNSDDSDALVNMGFLKILNNLEKYKREIPFTFWMRKVMINTIIDEYRKDKKRKELHRHIDFNESYAQYDSAVTNDFIKQTDAQQIYLLIAELPPTSKQVFNLFVIDGYSHKEISAMLGMSEGTSKWHLNYARNKLKEMLATLADINRIKIAAS